MNVFYAQLLLSLLCGISLSFADEGDEPTDLSRNHRFHSRERLCSYRRHQGFCTRRSDCKKPTRHICKFGRNPIVCCLDEREPKPTTSTKRPVTKRPFKPEPVRELDLTFPGCGFRVPKIQKDSRSSNEKASNTRSGLFSRRGERRSVQHVIVGGVSAAANSWPWMVAIFKEVTARTPKRFLCGASLISKRYVMSAAHCFDGEKGSIDPSKFTVVVGSHTSKDGTEYTVDNILIHPDYKQRQYYNDISLLRLRRDVELTQKVYPICVPSDGLRDKINTKNNNVTVTGWGDTSFGGVSSKVLQELHIPIVPLKECNTSYSKLLLASFPKGITNLFICAGVEEGGKDACQGDSGGPLVSKLSDNSYVQLGVVSFGYGCAQPGFPGVYTRVSQYGQWLYDNTDLGKK